MIISHNWRKDEGGGVIRGTQNVSLRAILDYPAALFLAHPHGVFITSGKKTRSISSAPHASSLRADKTPVASYAWTT